jgi:two-component system, NarL family, response regulator DegU
MPMNSPKIRIAVFDNNPKSRKHLVMLLGNETDLDVVAESEINLAGISDVEEQKPDVILMDSTNAFTDGLESTEMVVSRFQDTRIIVLSMDRSSTMAGSSCYAGACFHVCRDCSFDEILAVIRGGQQPV